jgi:hypothetical protein
LRRAVQRASAGGEARRTVDLTRNTPVEWWAISFFCPLSDVTPTMSLCPFRWGNHNLAAARSEAKPAGGRVLPIRRLLQGSAFAPHEVQVLSDAFDAALRELRLVDRSDPAVELVAKRIIQLASRGERDPDRLREGAVKGT